MSILNKLATIISQKGRNVVANRMRTMAQKHSPKSNPSNDELVAALTKALTDENLPTIQKLVELINIRLGSDAGVPEITETYQTWPVEAEPIAVLDATERAAAAEAMLDYIDTLNWWTIGLDPTNLNHALREVAEVITGCCALYRAGYQTARALSTAIEGANFLIWAQGQAGNGCYPFPAYTAGGSNALTAAARFLAGAAADGRLNQVLNNGWIIDDYNNGGIQFDNGECGAAMLELYAITGTAGQLNSAISAGGWAANRPLIINWNYNAFSAFFLARLATVTGTSSYFDSALNKLLKGVIPGQLTSGARTGRWDDGHNARATYHYIIMRALVDVMIYIRDIPAANITVPQARDYATVLNSLTLGLTNRNYDFVSVGAPTKDGPMGVLISVNEEWAGDSAFLTNTYSASALSNLGKLVSYQYRNSATLPLSPGPMGLFLEYIS